MPGEPTPLDAFPAAALDRRSELRGDDAALRRWWEDPRARVVAVHDGSVAVAAIPTDPASAALGVGDVVDPRHLDAPRVLLGVDGQARPWWLVLAMPDGSAAVRWAELREIGPHLSALQLEALMTAAAMQGWHARHGFCPACGGPTVPVQGGWVRRCSADGTEHYPRTDPAVIVLVIDASDRALLGRQVRWPAPWRSALAGFVEPGERAEAAVRREVAEEVGLPLDRVQYLASQPWPFPGSLMLGFHAWTTATDVAVDGEEIAEAQWYSRDELDEAAAAGRIQLPPAISIARGLIEQWFGSPLPGSWLRT